MRHKFLRRLRYLAWGFGLLAGIGGTVPAALAEEAASAGFATEQGRGRLISGEPAVRAGDTVQLGLQFQLASHWKIYSRSPGDAGYPHPPHSACSPHPTAA